MFLPYTNYQLPYNFNYERAALQRRNRRNDSSIAVLIGVSLARRELLRNRNASSQGNRRSLVNLFSSI